MAARSGALFVAYGQMKKGSVVVGCKLLQLFRSAIPDIKTTPLFDSPRYRNNMLYPERLIVAKILRNGFSPTALDRIAIFFETCNPRSLTLRAPESIPRTPYISMISRTKARPMPKPCNSAPDFWFAGPSMS